LNNLINPSLNAFLPNANWEVNFKEGLRNLNRALKKGKRIIRILGIRIMEEEFPQRNC